MGCGGQNGACYFLPGTSEQMLEPGAPRWGTAGACCKSLQHQQFHEPPPHASADPELLGGCESTVVTTRRPDGPHEQWDGKTGCSRGKRRRGIAIVLKASECKRRW